MTTPLAVGLFFGLVYGSFLEWFIHKIVMHSTSISQLAFDRHAIEHHMQRRSLKTFYMAPHEDSKYHLGESSVIPLLWFGHLPIYLTVGYFYNVWAGVGVAASGLLYLLGYEFIHFFIHVPKNHWFQLIFAEIQIHQSLTLKIQKLLTAIWSKFFRGMTTSGVIRAGSVI